MQSFSDVCEISAGTAAANKSSTTPDWRVVSFVFMCATGCKQIYVQADRRRRRNWDAEAFNIVSWIGEDEKSGADGWWPLEKQMRKRAKDFSNFNFHVFFPPLKIKIK